MHPTSLPCIDLEISGAWTSAETPKLQGSLGKKQQQLFKLGENFHSTLMAYGNGKVMNCSDR
jgi:hypothetical protein